MKIGLSVIAIAMFVSGVGFRMVYAQEESESELVIAQQEEQKANTMDVQPSLKDEAIIETEQPTASAINTPTIVENGTIGTITWTLDDQGVLHIGAGEAPINFNWGEWHYPFAQSVVEITLDGDVKPGNNTANMFSFFPNLTKINNLNNLDTSEVVDMFRMFYHSPMLTSIDVSHFNTRNVSDMTGMFAFLDNVTYLDLRSFDTSSVTKMREMFYQSGMESVDISSFDTSLVTDMSSMFCLTKLKSVDVSHFDTSRVENFRAMFSTSMDLTSLDLSNFVTTNANDVERMFYNLSSLESLDISQFDLRNTTNTVYLFNLSDNLKELTLGPNFRFKADFNLSNPLQNEMYTGNWSYLESGSASTNTPAITPTQFLNYDGSKPGTYVWQSQSYRVNYDLNGGLGTTPLPIVTQYGQLLPQVESLPSRVGYRFIGFNTQRDGSGITWDYATMTMPADNFTLYAQWQANAINITLKTTSMKYLIHTSPSKEEMMADYGVQTSYVETKLREQLASDNQIEVRFDTSDVNIDKVGNYVITIYAKDVVSGMEASQQAQYIVYANKQESSAQSVETFDTTKVVLWYGLLAVFGGVIVYGIKRKTKR